MSLKNASRNRPMVCVGFVIAMAVITVGILSAGQPPEEKGIGAATDQVSKRLARLKPTFVPGEIIVKLTDRQADGIGLLSQQDATGHQTALLRLQADYGLSNEGPVFGGAHQRLKNEDTPRQQSSGKIGILSSAGPKVAAGKSTAPELLRFYLLRTDRDVPGVCAELRGDPDVEFAQPNYIYERCGAPNDPEFPDQYAHQLIQMSEAWDISTGSHDIVVAVLDTGVDANHPDLKDNIWVNKGEIPNNEIDDDNNGYIDDVSGWNFEDDSNDVIPEFGWYGVEGHGTQVSGVIAGVGNNGIGVSGVNWQSSIMVLRMSIFVTSAEVAEGLDYAAANGAHVLNMSFGANEFGPGGDSAVKAAIDNAYAQGVLLVASAGNDDTTEPLYPAAYYHVMAVSSTNGEDMKTGHSSFGHWVDIAAPGTDIVTTDLNNEYIATAGTSFSGPYVAAVGALVLAQKPELTHVEVRAILENTTDPVYYGDLDPDHGYVGTGRVNAYTALLESDRRLPLGEIVEPKPRQTFTPDGNDIPLTLFVHGDSYQLEYRGFGQDEWGLLNDGSSPIDPNGFVHLTFTNPGTGTFELRLDVTTEGAVHTDRKIFGIELGAEMAPWPIPELPEDIEEVPDYMYLGSPLCFDVDGDGRNEIIEASITMGDYYYEGTITIWKDDGTALEGWPAAIGGDTYSSMTASGLAAGDIDGDGDFEIVVVDDYNVMATALHAESGQTVEGDWPIDVGDYWYAYIIGSPVLADLDSDGDSEIIVALDEESRESDGLFAIQGDGTYLWQRRYTTEGPISVADFDGDGDVEIALSGFGPGITRIYTFILDHDGQQIKRWLGGSAKGTAIADLDADGEPELVFCTEDSVMAVHIDGSKLWEARVRETFGRRFEYRRH
ncbi:MAG: S8 family serine peptidase [Planctomycetota bacterium]|jgi:subtilisin family serine protease